MGGPGGLPPGMHTIGAAAGPTAMEGSFGGSGGLAPRDARAIESALTCFNYFSVYHFFVYTHLEFLRRVLGEVLGVRGFEIRGPFRESAFLTGSEILQKSYLLEPGS